MPPARKAMPRERCSAKRCAALGSADQEKLRAALEALELDTVLGRYKVDPKTRGADRDQGRRRADRERQAAHGMPPELQAAKPVCPIRSGASAS